ncbi:MAG: 3-deoxy-manno-octulosonate cytidylyltransferase [Candidatus Omnitrophica bacterium]|nr:3-deoxy-manno-octulosonate cytidylyltransferase [Candidatus Omnitrophota bacterium]
MEAIGIIPARYGSTRFEGKVLADLMGKPVIQHVYEMAKKAKTLDDLIIATDDERIYKCVEGFGGKAVLTSIDQPTGTDRLTEVVNPIDVKIIVNVQGDEPLVHYTMIDELVRTMLEDDSINMATAIKRVEDKDEIMDPNIVKAVIDKQGFALYFSRSPIPFERGAQSKNFYKHLGIYAYTKDFLFTFTNLPKSDLEGIECLEQLRALENGYKIKAVETRYNTIGIDTPEDLEKARELLLKREEAKK